MCERQHLSKFLESKTWVLENHISIKQLVALGQKISLPAHRGKSFWLPLHYAIVFRHYRTDIYEQVMQSAVANPMPHFMSARFPHHPLVLKLD